MTSEISKQSYWLNVNIDELLLNDIDAFVNVVVITAIEDFLEDESLVDEDFILLPEGV